MSTDRPQGLGIYRTHPYHVPGGAVPVWEPMLGLLGTATNPSRVEHDHQGGKGVHDHSQPCQLDPGYVQAWVGQNITFIA